MLGFKHGRATSLRRDQRTLTIEDWVGEGGVREDDAWRFLFHFHDPLRPRETAGLGAGPVRFSSSMTWMHDPAQRWSWPWARRMYYAALTEEDPVRRDAMWADLFRALGQMMHLVVDASVPEHTRNDMHPLGAMKVENSYERWVGRQHEANPTQEAAFVAKYFGAPIGFAEELLAVGAAAVEPAELLPVARLIDADRYTGANPGVTVGADVRSPLGVGLAEIANANFFSEDTLRGQYPSPTDAGLIPVNLTTPLGKVRRYFSRPAGQGLLPANPLKAECASDALHLRAVPAGRPPYPCVDPLVWNQVAAHMLPRAVGYARGVLDYFFRGSLAVTDVSWDDSGVRMDIWNTSRDAMDGVFEIWARHDPDTPAERRTKLATIGEGERILLEPGYPNTFAGIRIPADARSSAKHVLVFRGRLGEEEDAVVAQVFTVPHIDVQQTTYSAETELVCPEPTTVSAPTPHPKTTVTVVSGAHRCEWRIVGHRVTGTLVTNMPIDMATTDPEPIVARIEARWGGAADPVPLVIDGRSVGGAWIRQGSEPDPRTFELLDPTARPVFGTLALVVTDTGGRQIVFPMARILSAVVAHEKMMVLDNRAPAGPVLVASRRSALALLSFDVAAYFETVTHSGFAAPLWAASQREFGNYAMSEGLFVSGGVFLQMEIDDFRTFAASEPSSAFYDSIVLTSPHPDGPTYTWDAEVRRIYQPMEREFLRAFVTATPVAFPVRLTGAGAAGTQ